MVYLMNMALIPPLLLMVYVYKLDSVEREPIKLLLKLFIFGMLSTIPAIILEMIGGKILNILFPLGTSTLFLLLENFIVIACSEEGGKYVMLKKGSWKHTAFDYVFDGVVYGAVTSLGFAAMENVMYLWNFGVGIGPVRALTAIPLHGIAGIFMGHYYGLEKMEKEKGNLELAKKNRRMSLLVPIFIHGAYDFAASCHSDVMGIAFVIFIIVVDIVAFRSIKRYAREDVRM